MKKYVSLLAAAAAALPAALGAPAVTDEVKWDTHPDTWVAVDELNRPVASADGGVTRHGVDPNTTVGMFYYIWHGQHDDSGKDISKLLADNPDNPDWGPKHYFHWGSRPWLGYYTAGDPYVVARHMQMLVDAGVDFLFFDCTNGPIYRNQVRAVLAEVQRRDSLGMRYPRLSFMIHSHPYTTLRQIYDEFYRPDPNSKYWYTYEGKPLLLGPLADTKTEAKEVGGTTSDLAPFFTWRNSWAWMRGQNPNEWPWLEYYPQAPGYTVKNGVKVPEQMSVSVAQHATTKIGKSYTAATRQPAVDKQGQCEATPLGLYFDEQWSEALRVHPPLVMVTQFNEWIAQRFEIDSEAQFGDVRPGYAPRVGESFFVDVYSPEFSRDLEPSAHPSVRDNYYLQLVSNVRRYRGVSPIPAPTVARTIDIAGPFSQWDDETVEYRDDIADTHFTGNAEQTPNALARPTHDLRRAKVIKDSRNIYFYIETTNPISDAATTPRWMRLLLNTDLNYTSGWSGYDYTVAIDPSTGRYSLMKHTGTPSEFRWKTVAPVSYRVEGNRLMLAIPRKKIGHAATEADIDFKWTDNISDTNPDPMDFISDGDVAPNGRFNYRYKGSLLRP